MSSESGEESRTQALIDQTLALHKDGYKGEIAHALNILPEVLKIEYLEALQACPEVVAVESDPLKFLRRENFNHWAAAVRLVVYWKLRKEVFQDAAYRPMVMSGDGALNKEDIKLLQSGLLSVLPPDVEGRTVICLDDTRIEEISSYKGLNIDACRRLCFYFGHLASENVISQSQGIVFLALISRPVKKIFDGNREPLLNLLSKALPVKIQKILLVQSSPETMSRSVFLDESVPNVLGFVGSALERLTVPIYGQSFDQVTDMIKFFGIERPQVPQGVKAASCMASTPSIAARDGPQPPASPGITPEFLRQLSLIPGDEHLVERTRLRKSSPLGKTSSINTPQSDDEAAGLFQLNEALNCMENSEKTAYLEVKRVAPHLIDIETPPLRFLRFERHSPRAAARRLVTYWTMRKDIFKERFSLPLSLADEGPSALRELDKEILRTGFFVNLPLDKKNRAVVLGNVARGILAPTKHELPERIRAFFFVAHVAAESATEVVVINIPPSGARVYQNNTKILLNCVEYALPMRLVHIYIAFMLPRNGWRSHMQFIFPRLMRIFPRDFLNQMTVHITGKRRDMLARFEASGFLESGLLECLGGSWTYATNFRSWLRERADLDAGRFCSFVPTLSAPVHDSSLLNVAKFSSLKVEDLGLSTAKHSQSSLTGPMFADHVSAVFATAKLMGENCLVNAISPVLMQQSEKEISAPRKRDFCQYSREQISCHELSPYQNARLRAPKLVDRETPLSRFLLYTRNDHVFAHELLDRYWKTRQALFGDRAFLPMNQSGEGALSQVEIKLLGEGTIVLLQSDASGRPVLCVNSSRLTSNEFQSNVMKRVAFYMGSLLSEIDTAQTDGCIVLLCLSMGSDLNFVLDEPLRLIFNSLPVHPHSVHLVGSPPECDRAHFNSALVPTVNVLLDWCAVPERHVHFCENKDFLARELKQVGLIPTTLPTCAGGTWSYERFSDWMDSRIRYEWELPRKKELNHGAAPIPNYTVKPFSKCSEEERVERKRRLHIIHSRRWRGRMKVEVDVLDAQAEELRQENKRLRDENRLLEERMAAVAQLLQHVT